MASRAVHVIILATTILVSVDFGVSAFSLSASTHLYRLPRSVSLSRQSTDLNSSRSFLATRLSLHPSAPESDQRVSPLQSSRTMMSSRSPLFSTTGLSSPTAPTFRRRIGIYAEVLLATKICTGHRRHSTLAAAASNSDDGAQSRSNTTTCLTRLRLWLLMWQTQCRRMAVVASIFMVCCMSSLSMTSSNPLQPPVAVAASTSTLVSPQSSAAASMSNRNSQVDAIIDRYVQQHMFDDDLGSAVDPIATTYQEVHEDATNSPGRHAWALRDIISKTVNAGKGVSSLGSTVTAMTDAASSGRSVNGLVSLIRGIQQKTGWSEMVVTMALAGVFVVAGPSLFLLAGMMVGNISKRNMDALFKKRYGDTYTVDATAKQEPVVEAPPDEDDEDDEDDDDDDDDETPTNKK